VVSVHCEAQISTKCLLLLITITVLSSCASTQKKVVQKLPPDNSSYDSDLLFFRSLDRGPAMDAYTKAIVEWTNRTKFDSRGNCGRFLKQPTLLLLVISADGTVLRATTSTDDKGAQCFRASYIGASVPKPPVAPYATQGRMNPPRR
jgi:hypothetical protein